MDESTIYNAACLLVAVGMSVLGVMGSWAAYRNGVTDGYGYSREPKCPGYAAAGEYLRRHMAHRWPELAGKPAPCRGSNDAELETLTEQARAIPTRL